MKSIHVNKSRARIAAVLIGVGVAASVHAQTDTSLLKFQVRPQGAPASAWTTDLHVLPGTIVEFRALITYTGSSPAVGLHNANFQPMVSAWDRSTDVLQPFRAWGTAAVPVPAGWQPGGVDVNSGLYGRVNPYAFAGIASTRALRGHTNLVAGVTYMRIAQSNATAWPGTGPTSGTAASNNYNGVSGLALGQSPPAFAGAAYVAQTQDVEVARFAILVGGMQARTMVVNADPLSIGTLSELYFQRDFVWHRDLSSIGNPAGIVRGAVTIQSAFIHVPTPGALSLLGFGAIVARRRQR